MTPERWQEVQRVFHDALERPAEVRVAFVADACGEDLQLRAEVVSLLSSAEVGKDFLESPVAPAAEVLPDRIGPYRVLGRLGHGGMGEVYLADRADEQFRKKVALKVVRQGLDADAVRRFRQERQILAGLEHPNIARLLDGGDTGDGRPYVVLEYVEGKNLLEWSDVRGLNVAERVALFRTVCGAVQFAHQNLVVHRDLKPANILVTEDGTPKLLDFGIAKLLNAGLAQGPPDVTQAERRLLTPDYASPEQLRGERITTASDVYALGVVLFELLTGRRPSSGATGNGAGLVRPDEEPEKPSAVAPPGRRREIAGDLDTIVLKALRKEPSRRYASAEQLAEDLRRHAVGLPVTARRDTLGYRAGKFVKRHRLGAGAAAVVLVTLVGGIVATARQARIAREEKARADRRFEDVRRLSNAFLFEFHDAIAPLPGSIPARELIVRRALEYLGTLAREAAGDRDLQRELAAAYEKLAEVQGVSGGAGLGDSAGALASLKAAVQIRESLVASEPTSLVDRGLLAKTLGPFGATLAATGDSPGSLVASRRAVSLLETVVSEAPGDAQARRALAGAHFYLSNRLSSEGDPAGTLAEMGKALVIYGQLSAALPADLGLRRAVALCHKYIASVHGDELNPRQDPAAALAGYTRSLAIEAELLARDPANALYKRDLSHSWGGCGEALFRLGRKAEGAEAYRKAIALRTELVAADPKNSGVRHSLARAFMNLGHHQTQAGEAGAAFEALLKALPILEDLHRRDPSNSFVASDEALVRKYVGDAHAARREWREARSAYEAARVGFAALESAGTLLPGHRAFVTGTAEAIARVDAAIGRVDAGRTQVGESTR